MPRIPIPFGVQEYRARHPGAGNQSAVNMVLEVQAQGNAAPAHMRRADGTGAALFDGQDFKDTYQSAFGNMTWQGTSYGALDYHLRGVCPFGSYLYFVVGNGVFKTDAAGTVVALTGSLPGDGRVWMERSDRFIVLLNTIGDAYFVDTGNSNGAFNDLVTKITDTAYKQSAWVQFYDQRFVFGVKNASTFFLSPLADPRGTSMGAAYDALEIATAESSPDFLVSGLRDHRDLLLFGEETVEIWYNEGGADFPYARAPDGLLEVGCAAAYSPARLDNTPIWLGVEHGGRSVRRLQGRTPMRISTPALDDELDSYAVVSDAFGMAWQFGGHSYYALTFPTEGVTWCFDSATLLWSRRRSLDSPSWRVGAVAPFNGTIYAMDLLDLNVAPFSRSSDTEFAPFGDCPSANIKWELITAPISSDGRAMTVRCVELRVDAGTQSTGSYVTGAAEPMVWLSWSDDDGRTWSNEHGRRMGVPGRYKKRLLWRNLGMTRTGRVFRIRGGDLAPAAIINAWADVEYGR